MTYFDVDIWGTVDEMTSAIATFLAVVVALFVADRDRRQRATEAREICSSMAPALVADLERYLDIVGGKGEWFEAMHRETEVDNSQTLVNRAIRNPVPVLDAYASSIHLFPRHVAPSLARARGSTLRMKMMAEDIRAHGLSNSAQRHREQLDALFLEATQDVRIAADLLGDEYKVAVLADNMLTSAFRTQVLSQRESERQ